MQLRDYTLRTVGSRFLDVSGVFRWTRVKTLLLGVLVLPGTSVHLALGQSIPHVFRNGEVADAEDVNENFAALLQAIGELTSRIDQLESRIRLLEEVGVNDTTIVLSHPVIRAGQGTLDVSLVTDQLVAGVELNIGFPDGVQLASCWANPEIEKGATSFFYGPRGCSPGVNCESLRALVLSLSNSDPIASGSLLFRCDVAVESASSSMLVLDCSNPGASDPGGVSVDVACPDSTLTLESAGGNEIRVGDVVLTRNGSSTIVVSLATTAPVAAIENQIDFPSGVQLSECVVNPGIGRDDSAFSFSPSGCTVGLDCDAVRALIVDFNNLAPIPDGAVYTCKIQTGFVASGVLPLDCSGPGASDDQGDSVPISCRGGTVTVVPN